MTVQNCRVQCISSFFFSLQMLSVRGQVVLADFTRIKSQERNIFVATKESGPQCFHKLRPHHYTKPSVLLGVLYVNK